MSSPLRSKIAAVAVLFFIGLFAGRVADLLNIVDERVRRGNQLTDQIRSTVTTLEIPDVAALEEQIADLQNRLAAGTATPAQVDGLRVLLARLRPVPGPAGPQGRTGASGPPGPAAAEPAATTSTTGAGGTTTTTRGPTPTSRPPATTTTRCTVGVGRLLKVGCQ